MRFQFLLGLALSICAASLTGQSNPVFNDDPMQQLPLGMEVSKYIIREPTGLPEVEPRVEPPYWWVDMVDPQLEILIYDRHAAAYDIVRTGDPAVSVDYVDREANPNYSFVGLNIKPGATLSSFILHLASSDSARHAPRTITYQLHPHPRNTWAEKEQLGPKDLIYLIMPDRFANGIPENDSSPYSQDTLVNRDKFLFRHGGDLRGIRQKLPYLQQLGVTAIWLNPILLNDQPYESYHGYATSDHYEIDHRLGDREEYNQLVEDAHARGIKVIMDVIFNHVGDQHYQIKDLPARDWIHQWPTFTKSNFRAATIFDPNGSEADRKQMQEGWFDHHMPDLNQQNPHLARYLINNSIWWTLVSGHDAFRIDTYTYPDTEFMAEWNRRLKEEIPHLGIFGETWVPHLGVQASFVGGKRIGQDVDTELPAVTDFQLYYAIHEALAAEPTWTDGVLRLYYTLAQDFVYGNPANNVVFLDNHDLTRLWTTLGEDLTKMKSALALLLTTRGTPCIYYGTELLLGGSGGAFGEGGRVDFPGGFPGDSLDLFKPEMRNAAQSEFFEFFSQLANYRKNSEALTTGKLVQFLPRDGVYVYFRSAGEEVVMTVFNGNSTARVLTDLEPYQEILDGRTTGSELTAAATLVELKELQLAPKATRVIVLKR